MVFNKISTIAEDKVVSSYYFLRKPPQNTLLSLLKPSLTHVFHVLQWFGSSLNFCSLQPMKYIYLPLEYLPS